MRPVDTDDFLKELKTERSLATAPIAPRTPKLDTALSEASVQELFDYYRKRWEKKYSGALIIPSVAAAKTSVRDVLKAASGDKLKVLRMIDIYFDNAKAYYRAMSHSLEVFKQDMQQLAAEASKASELAKPAAPLRVSVNTLCPQCGDNFELECSIVDLDKVVLVTPCEKCKGRMR